VLIPIVAVGFSSARERWLRIERWSILVYFVYALSAIVANLTNLVYAMIFRSSEISGSQLIMSSVAVWAAMILMYSLLYWQLDRGGPESRLAGTGSRPDWLFPQAGAPAEDVPPDWRPIYVDYLFLSYTTATAFSPTDTLPLSPRAKLLMMLESATSLMTIIVIAARAINILG
jgi:uncharacterized membrane protein